MKDRNLTHKFWARCVAFCLFCVIMALLAGCLMASLVCYYEGWYQGEYPANEAGYLHKLLYIYRNSFLIGAVASGVLVVVLFIFLLCSAGHVSGTNEYRLIRQDTIPLDVYFVAWAACVAAATAGFIALFNMGGPFYVGALLMTMVIAAFVMAFCMTLAARVKCGDMWKNTWSYKILRGMGLLAKKTGKGVGKLYSNLHLAGRAAGIYCALLLVNLVLLIAAMEDTVMWLVLLVIIDFLGLLLCLDICGQLLRLKDAGAALAEGDMTYTAELDKLKWDFREHGENLNSISAGLAKAVEERMKSERVKTELITNVSHDLKTPLTSIVSYIDLLQKENVEGEKAMEYIETITRQSAKLKKLTEDLVDASKASAGAVNVNLERVNVSELLRQCVGEYEARMEAAEINPIVTLPEEDIYAVADGRLLWRVIDNLMGNICRHGMAGTRAYMAAEKRENSACITFKNISSEQLNIPVEELMERFVQGDRSRSGGGSGLGLSIAQSLTELMGGRLQLHLDGDLFKAELTFREE